MYTQIPISSDHEGRRIDNFIISHLKFPKSLVYKLLRKGGIKILQGGKKKNVKPDYRICIDDQLHLPLSLKQQAEDLDSLKHAEANIVPAGFLKKAPNIIFENSDYMIVDKPGNIAVQGGKNIEFTIMDILQRTTKSELYLAHRIDMATSGCLLLAKNMIALKHFHSGLQSKSIVKKYICIVCGHTPEQWDAMGNLIINGKSMQAKSVFSTLCHMSYIGNEAKEQPFSLVSAQPITGRKHQLRIHLKDYEFPVLGDNKYGNFAINRQLQHNGKFLMLHAHSLAFVDLANRKIGAKAPLPARFQKFLLRTDMDGKTVNSIIDSH